MFNLYVTTCNDKSTPEAFTLCLDFSYQLEKNKRLLKSKNPEDIDIQIADFAYATRTTVRIAGTWYLATIEPPSFLYSFTWYTLCLSYDFHTQAITLACMNRILIEEEIIFPNRTFSTEFLTYLSTGEREGACHFTGDLTRVNIWSKGRRH